MRASLNPVSGGSYGELTSTSFADPVLDARLIADFPLDFPTAGTPLDDNQPNLLLSMSDLGNVTDIEVGNPAAPNFLLVPDFTSQFAALNFADELDAITDGWEGFFTLLDGVIDNQVLVAQIPLIGDHLVEGAKFIQDIKEKVVDNFEESGQKTIGFVQQKLIEALGPNGTDWLIDFSTGENANDPADVDDLVVVSPPKESVDQSTEQVQFDMKLGGTQTLAELPLDLGLDGLGLSIDGQVQVALNWELSLGVGVSKTHGVYFDTSLLDELTFELVATLPGLDASGSLGFLNLSVTDKDSLVSAGFRADLKDPNNDGKLTLAEISSVRNLSKVVDASVDVDANVRLEMIADMGSADFPSIRSDFVMSWNLTDAQTASGSGSFGGATAPTVGFENVGINAGELINGFAGSLIGRITEALEPVEPVIDVLTTEITPLSKLIGSPINVLDLAAIFGYVDPTTYEFLDAATKIFQLGQLAQSFEDGFIEIGSFAIDDVDLRSESPQGESVDPIGVQYPGSVQNFLDASRDIPSGDGGGFEFTILEQPESIFRLLLGHDITLFGYDMPPIAAELEMRESYPIFPPFLTVILSGGVRAAADFAFGFDTYGLRRFQESGYRDFSTIFDGFYVSDTPRVDATGDDTPELELNAYIAAAGIAGRRF